MSRDRDFVEQTLLFAAEVGKDINTLRKLIGNINDLTTVEKESLVKALNEIKSNINEIGDGSTSIPDWSEQLNETTNF